MSSILKAIRWSAYHTLISLPCLLLLVTVAWPVYALVHYVVAPVLYYALCIYGFVVGGLLKCITVPTSLAFTYLFMPPARLLAGPFVRRKAKAVMRARDEFRAQFGIEGVSGFTRDQLVFGANRQQLGRAQMMLQTAESNLQFAAEQGAKGYWFSALGYIWNAQDHLANARTELALVPSDEFYVTAELVPAGVYA